MAQAPDLGGAGAPRQNKTVKEFAGMNTQNERNAIPAGSFHWLENIQPIGPGHLHSIPGRSSAVVRIPPNPTPPPEECTDLSERGQQLITIETAFDQATTFGGGNLRTSWGYINNGELYSLIGQAGCGGGNMPAPSVCVQVNHYINDNPTLDSGTPAPSIVAPDSFINTRIGSADRFVWAANSNAYLGGGMRFFYDLGNTFQDYAIPVHGGSANAENFAISGNDLWIYSNNGGQTYFPVYALNNSTVLTEYQPFGTDHVIISNMQFTDNFLYCIGSFSGVQRLYKIDRSNGTIVDSLNVTALGVQFVCVADDNLQYLLCAGTPASVYYVNNFTDPVYVGYTPAQGFVPFGLGTGLWNNGTIYYGSNGFGGFTTDVFKIQIPCASPVDAPMIASVTTDPTVVNGSPISVTWADILLPAADDKIYIKPAPAAGTLGLVGATIASFTNASALAAGTTPITIPGGTTPGNYVAMYAAKGSIWAATSAVFTVT